MTGCCSTVSCPSSFTGHGGAPRATELAICGTMRKAVPTVPPEDCRRLSEAAGIESSRLVSDHDVAPSAARDRRAPRSCRARRLLNHRLQFPPMANHSVPPRWWRAVPARLRLIDAATSTIAIHPPLRDRCPAPPRDLPSLCQASRNQATLLLSPRAYRPVGVDHEVVTAGRGRPRRCEVGVNGEWTLRRRRNKMRAAVGCVRDWRGPLRG